MLVISFSKYFRLGLCKEWNDRSRGINLGYVSLYISKMEFEDYVDDVKMDSY